MAISISSPYGVLGRVVADPAHVPVEHLAQLDSLTVVFLALPAGVAHVTGGARVQVHAITFSRINTIIKISLFEITDYSHINYSKGTFKFRKIFVREFIN